MSTEAAAHSGHFENYRGFTSGKFAMWLFLASDAMGFMGLIGAYMVLRISSDNWMVNDLDPPFGIDLTAFMTFLLIVSSVTMVKALSSIQKGNQKGLLFWLGCTILGGLTFLGLQIYEWDLFINGIMDLRAKAGLTDANQGMTGYQQTFFTLTGFHGLHVLSGVIYLSCIWRRAKQGAYTADNHSPVELVGLFWHFVDLVWIVLFTILYLFPDTVTDI
ncbi:MAG: cytochrome c oxidase subunit 3 [Planctomycetota bacterium]|jgi:heme/copper-type cytochrome/quinol oxidase subunit 3